MHESEVAQSYLALSDPMDCSPPGSSVHGIFQAKVLEWGATALSDICASKNIYIHTQAIGRLLCVQTFAQSHIYTHAHTYAHTYTHIHM